VTEDVILPPRSNMVVAMRKDKTNAKKGNHMILSPDSVYAELGVMVPNSVIEINNREVNAMISNLSPSQKSIKQGAIIGNCEVTEEQITELANQWNETGDEKEMKYVSGLEGIRGKQIFENDATLVEELDCESFKVKIGEELNRDQQMGLVNLLSKYQDLCD